jgi:hypothetical protein
MQASEAAGMPWGHVISTAGGGSVSVLGAGAAAAALNKCDSLLYLNRQCTDNRLSYVCTQCVLLLSPAADQKAIQRYTAAVSGRRNVTTCE